MGIKLSILGVLSLAALAIWLKATWEPEAAKASSSESTNTEWPPQFVDAYRIATQSIAAAASGRTWFEPFNPTNVTFDEKTCRVAVKARELNNFGLPTEKKLMVDLWMIERGKLSVYAIWDYSDGQDRSKEWPRAGARIWLKK